MHSWCIIYASITATPTPPTPLYTNQHMGAHQPLWHVFVHADRRFRVEGLGNCWLYFGKVENETWMGRWKYLCNTAIPVSQIQTCKRLKLWGTKGYLARTFIKPDRVKLSHYPSFWWIRPSPKLFQDLSLLLKQFWKLFLLNPPEYALLQPAKVGGVFLCRDPYFTSQTTTPLLDSE